MHNSGRSNSESIRPSRPLHPPVPRSNHSLWLIDWCLLRCRAILKWELGLCRIPLRLDRMSVAWPYQIIPLIPCFWCTSEADYRWCPRWFRSLWTCQCTRLCLPWTSRRLLPWPWGTRHHLKWIRKWEALPGVRWGICFSSGFLFTKSSFSSLLLNGVGMNRRSLNYLLDSSSWAILGAAENNLEGEEAKRADRMSYLVKRGDLVMS